MQPIGLDTPAAPPAPAPAPAADEAGFVDEQASPEEQAKYDTFVSLAMDALYDEKFREKTVNLLKKAPDPVKGIAEVSTQLAMRVYQNARQNKESISGDVLLNAGAEIVELVVEFAEGVAGLGEISEEQMNSAFLQAATMFSAEMKRLGIYSEKDQQQDVSDMQAMSQSGKLQQLTQAPPAAPGAAPPMPPQGGVA